MYEWLTAAAAVLGSIALIATGMALRDMIARRSSPRSSMDVLGRWTVADYAAVFLFLIGFVFLLAVSLLSIRDRAELPYYHLGYVLTGFVVISFAGLFAFVRLFVLLRLIAGAKALSVRAASSEHQEQPDEADRAE
ncbi:hypothetical protein ACFQWB_12105 [Paenibacillus thermoaerophilus]|uniref:Uncharacterized protein n=1 Tax=Paenibacillus thermoaerophilus TaxID=1215385 RepID=A0ABW2V5Y7_9BACL|nr:hypothetical protein [Paenibacillus thermoaerophilus]TMV11977.1 hypothetical protein FE781_12295 [Paenibacillus thermoaerophilus]